MKILQFITWLLNARVFYFVSLVPFVRSSISFQTDDFTIAIFTNDTVKDTRMRPEYLSVTIDFSILANSVGCNWSSPRLHTMSKALSAAGSTYLRVGGTLGDEIWYNMSSTDPSPPPNASLFPGGTFSKSTWDEIAQFAINVDFKIVFGINLGPGPRDTKTGAWIPDNALELIKYTLSRAYPVIAFEAGNEPDLFKSKFKDLGFSVSPQQYAQDIALFARIVKEANSSLLVVAPDSNFIPVVGDFLFLESLLSFAKTHKEKLLEQVDVFTWHFYPSFAPEHYSHSNLPFFLWPLIATPRLMLNISLLNQVDEGGAYINSIVHKSSKPFADVWLGETASACGGGATNVSDSFADGFEFLDKLGSMALRGHGVIFRQTLCGSRYGLISTDLQPRPSYFIALLFKQLVGVSPLPVSIDTTKESSHSTLGVISLRVYAFCATQRASAEAGAIVVVAINVDPEKGATFILGSNSSGTNSNTKFQNNAFSGPRKEYILTAPGGITGLQSSSVIMNGNATILHVATDGTPPIFKPVIVTNNSASAAILPPASYGFFVLPGARSSTCTSYMSNK